MRTPPLRSANGGVGEVTNQGEVLAELDLVALLALPQAIQPALEPRGELAVVTHTTEPTVMDRAGHTLGRPPAVVTPESGWTVRWFRSVVPM